MQTKWRKFCSVAARALSKTLAIVFALLQPLQISENHPPARSPIAGGRFSTISRVHNNANKFARVLPRAQAAAKQNFRMIVCIVISANREKPAPTAGALAHTGGSFL